MISILILLLNYKVVAASNGGHFYGSLFFNSNQVNVSQRIPQIIQLPGYLLHFNYNGNVSALKNNLNVSFGYGYQWQHYYMGCELTKDTATKALRVTSFSEKHDLFASEFTIKNNFRIMMTPGWNFTPNTLFFTTFGFSSDRIKFLGGVNGIMYHKNKYSFDPVMGFGVTQNITRNITTSLQYQFTTYSLLHANENVSTLNFNVATSNHVQIASHAIMLSVNYNYFTQDLLFSPSVDQRMKKDGAKAFDGIYFNVASKFTLNHVKQNIHLQAPSSYENFNGNHLSSNMGFYAAIGEGLQVDKYFLGLELGKVFIDHTNKATSFFATGITPLGKFKSEQKSWLTIHNYYSVNLKPGLVLTPNTLLYCTIGIEKYAMKLSNFYQRNEGNFKVEENYHIYKNITSLEKGVGIAFKLSEHLSLWMESNYTSPAKITMKHNFLVMPANEIKTLTNRVTVRNGSLRFGINFYL